MARTLEIASTWHPNSKAIIYNGDCLEFLRSIPASSIQLIVTSPPYNIGKTYEKKQALSRYVEDQKQVIRECNRVLKSAGSICWQVGNYIEKQGASSIVPLDIALYPLFSALGLKMRNRIIWHFEHGLHCSKRFSGRYETIIWFTKSDNYLFRLDPVRVPQKYPGKKYFKGPRAGEYSCNPLGKNPGDLWTFPNVKNNHVEKTPHPCQFPVELAERLILSLSDPDDWVLDPYIGAGTTAAAAIKNDRRGAGAETLSDYAWIARTRMQQAFDGSLKFRPMNTPVYDPRDAGAQLTTAPWLQTNAKKNGKHPKSQSIAEEQARELFLFERALKYRIKP